MDSPDRQRSFHALRRRAEQCQHPFDAHLPATADPDSLRLVRELQIHQVELEMQNEELLAAQVAAEISQAQYADLYDSAPVGYCTLDYKGVLRQLNRHASQLLGQAVPQLLGRRLALYVEPAERTRLAGFLTRLWAHPGELRSCELRLQRLDGQQLYVQVEGLVTLPNPELEQESGCRLALLDVSERRLAAEALAASAARFRATFEQSRDGMILLEDNRFADANNAALRLLGLTSPEQLLGRPLADFWPDTQPDGRPTREVFGDCLEKAEVWGWCRLELLRHREDGRPVWDELSFNPVVLDGKALLHAAWRDVTARKQAEQQLQASEARLQQALAAAETGIWDWDLGTGALFPDARAQEIFGLPSGLPFALLQASIHPADLEQVEQVMGTAIVGRTSFDLEHRLVRADGSVRYVAATGRFDYDEATGQPVRLRGLVRDVTARHRTEQELDYKNRLLGNLLRNAPLILARVGSDGRFREHVGPPLRRIGLADNELVGRRVTDEFPGAAERLGLLLAGQPVNYTAVVVRGDEKIYCQVFGFFDHEQQEAVLFGTDITELEHLKEEATQARLRQQQELIAAVLNAQEAERSRIAESLHNGLGQLLYATKLQLDRLPVGAEPSARQQAARLLGEAIRQTRAISHELSPALLEEHGLPAALRAICQSLSSPALHWRCLIELDADHALPQPLQVAVYRLAQELAQNVVKHARARVATLEVEALPGWVVLRVEDDGRGFDPARSADGLGLRTLRSRVALLGGTAHFDSAPGSGSQVQIRLPVR